MWRSVVLPAMIAAFIVAGTVYSEVHMSTFATLPFPVQVAKVMTGLLGIVAPLLAAVNAFHARREKRDKDAQTTLLAALVKIAAKAKVAVESVGLHAYVVQRPFPWIGQVRQKRIARIRLSSHPPPSTIEWVKGKGYIGACWEDDAWADFEFDRVYAGYTRCASAAEWARVPAKLRFGLTFQEWKNSRVYRLVRVYPIHVKRSDGRHKYAGCISLDTISDASVAPLLSDEVRGYMAQAAETVAVALTTMDS